MASNNFKVFGKLPADVKAALEAAVKRFNSQTKVATELGVSSAVVSTLLKDKYPGNVAAMEQRIRGQFMSESVTCPVQGTLSKRSCLDNQALPMAFTNPVRAALWRACKTCPNRKDLSS
jgi:fructose 1,6-bisphosphatase